MTSDIYQNFGNGKGKQFSTLIFNKYNLSWFSFILTGLSREITFTQLKSINKIKNLLNKTTSQEKMKAELLPLSNNLSKYFDLLGLLSKVFVNKNIRQK